MPAATSSQAGPFGDEITTFAPCAASLRAMALPIPREEPVTIATFPARSNNVTALSPKFQGAAETTNPSWCSSHASRLRPLHYAVNNNERWVIFHLCDKPF